MDKKIVQFNPVRQKKLKEKIPVVSIGTIYLDLLISCNGKDIYFRPSYELKKDIDDELLGELSDMLKTGFSEAIDQLFTFSKSDK